MSEEHDAFTEPESSEPMGEPLGPDKVLSLVCVLWLLNLAIGARVAVKGCRLSGLPASTSGGTPPRSSSRARARRSRPGSP